MTKLTSNEFLAIDQMMNDTCDWGKMDMVVAANRGSRIVEMTLCETGVEDIAERLEMTVPQAKGVLGSLVKKGYAHVWENDVNGRIVQMMNVTVEGILAWDEL